MQNFLDFEEPVVQLEDKLKDMRKVALENGVDVGVAIQDLETKIKEKKKEVYNKLSRWQRVQLSRHPNRPYTLDYINCISTDFNELHGDRNFKDDKAIVGGFGNIGSQTVIFIGHQKGRDTKERTYRNFGMANPEGYRKALRLMKLAEKFDKPVISFIDTPGAYPGIEAEERGQAEAIARNLFEMAQLKVPVLCFVIGEGASGGALGIGLGNRVYMLENTWYSVISPESCSSILWRSWDHKEEAAEALKLTAKDNYQHKLIDGIIKEPLGGAHQDVGAMCKTIKNKITKDLKELKNLSTEDLVKQRIEKFSEMGVFND